MTMVLLRYIDALREHGDVEVDRETERSPAVDAHVEAAITAFEQEHRQGCPDGMPAFEATSAAWSLQLLYRSSQLLVLRDLDVTCVQSVFAERCPADASRPETVYSVDVFLQYLPDLMRLARGLAAEDPLVAALAETAADWPLSAAGGAAAPPPASHPVRQHPGLRRLYVDRVVSRTAAAELDRDLALQILDENHGIAPFSGAFARRLDACCAGTETECATKESDDE
jgi:hypothetical protein